MLSGVRVRRPAIAVLVLVTALTHLGLVAGVATGTSVDEAEQELELTRQELAEARRERDAVQARLDAAAEELAALQQRVAELEAERDELGAQLVDLQGQLDAASQRIAGRLREVYKRGAGQPLALFLSSDDPEEALGRVTTVQQLVEGDLVGAEETTVTQTQVQAVADRLAAKQAELDAALATQEEVAARLRTDLERAAELEEQLEGEERDAESRLRNARAEAARRAAAAGAATRSRSGSGGSSGAAAAAAMASTSGGTACPIDRPRSFTDTWGAARSGGRAHRGVDMLAPYGTGVRAIVSGIWETEGYGPSAGYWGILHGDDGNQYWYMHLQSYVVGGGHVAAGQLIATNGDTGNAAGTPHLHFEVHPGGGSAVNPYPTARAACG